MTAIDRRHMFARKLVTAATTGPFLNALLTLKRERCSFERVCQASSVAPAELVREVRELIAA